MRPWPPLLPAELGEVVKGMDVVDDIRFVATAGKMPFRKDVPVENVVIQSVKVVDQLPEGAAKD